jgi:hypothetical protein
LWAEPSLYDAAAKLRWVYEHQQEARLLGQKALADAEQVLSIEASGRRMLARLEEIRQLRARVATNGQSHSEPATNGSRYIHLPHALARIVRKVRKGAINQTSSDY